MCPYFWPTEIFILPTLQVFDIHFKSSHVSKSDKNTLCLRNFVTKRHHNRFTAGSSEIFFTFSVENKDDISILYVQEVFLGLQYNNKELDTLGRFDMQIL